MRRVLSVVRVGLIALVVLALVATRLLPVPAIILSIPFLVMLATKPVLRRLAIGNMTRRKRETVLVLLGAMLGTAIITGSLVVGDTLDASLRRGSFTQLGPIDIVASSGIENAGAVADIVDGMDRDDVDGTLRLTGLQVIVASTGDDTRADPAAQLLETDFVSARNFGDDPDITGISGPTPKPGEAVLGEDLAETLAVSPGDAVVVHAYGTQRRLTVVRVLPQVGVAGFTPGSQSSSSPVLFAAPGTIEELRTEGPRPGAAPSGILAVSLDGGVLDTLDDAEAVSDELNKALSRVPALVTPVKKDLVDTAVSLGNQFTSIFTLIGLFSVLAGVLLLVNIFVMLAQERQPELGMLRAVGLRRSGLVGSFSLEGWMYAIGSAVLGTAAGLGVGRLIVLVAAPIFAGGQPGSRESLELTYAASRASVSTGFLVGFVISLCTVVLTSLWISRLNVIRAIRDLPNPTSTRQRLAALVFGIVLLLVGIPVTMGGVSNNTGVAVLLGPSLIAVGAVFVFGRLIPRRPLTTVAALGVLAWATFSFDVLGRAFRGGGMATFITQGVVLTAAAVALVSQNQELVGKVLRLIAGSRGLAVRLGLAYPLARRFRTGMTLAMYALVAYMLALITVFSQLFGGQVRQFERQISAGFDIVATSNPTNPIDIEALSDTDGIERVASIAEVAGEFDSANTDGFRVWPAAAFDADFVADGAPQLTRRDPRYPTDRAAYEAVLADSSLFIPGGFFLERGGGPPRQLNPGDEVVLRDPVSGQSKTLTVAAIGRSGFGNLAPLMSYEALTEVFGDRVVPNKFYIGTSEDADASDVATAINGRFIPNGADARPFSEMIRDNLGQQQQFFKLMQGYLALGLLVGIAGLGVVMVRAVRERRREVGVLRSLGFESSAVRGAFVTESGFVAFEGIAIGVVLAVVTAWRLVGSTNFGGPSFQVPWTPLGVIVLGTLVASLAATVVPAQQASRIRPAVALRITTD